MYSRHVESVETNLPTPQESKFAKDLYRISGDYFFATLKCTCRLLPHPLLASPSCVFQLRPDNGCPSKFAGKFAPSATGVGWTHPGTSHCSRFLFSTLFVYIAPLLLAPGLVSSAVNSAAEPNKDHLADTVIVIFQRIITTTCMPVRASCGWNIHSDSAGMKFSPYISLSGSHRPPFALVSFLHDVARTSPWDASLVSSSPGAST
jgi:hypothetical protein